MSSVDRTPVNMTKESTSKLHLEHDVFRGDTQDSNRRYSHDLHVFDVAQQWLAKHKLCNDCAERAACCRNTVCGGTVTGGEHFSRDDERGCVRTKIIEEVGEAVQENKSVLTQIRGIERNVCKGYGVE